MIDHSLECPWLPTVIWSTRKYVYLKFLHIVSLWVAGVSKPTQVTQSVLCKTTSGEIQCVCVFGHKLDRKGYCWPIAIYISRQLLVGLKMFIWTLTPLWKDVPPNHVVCGIYMALMVRQDRQLSCKTTYYAVAWWFGGSILQAKVNLAHQLQPVPLIYYIYRHHTAIS